MDEVTNPTQDGNGGQGQAPAQSTQPPTGNAPGKESGKVVFDSEEALQQEIDRRLGARLAKERDKYKDYNDLRKAADELQTIKDAQLSEQERLNKQLKETEARAERAEQQARQKATFSTVVTEAAKLGFHDPAMAYKLLDSDAIEYDDNGDPKNVAALVKALAETNKFLIKRPGGLEPFDPGGPGGQLRETVEQKRARLYGGAAANVWDGDGGGVIWPKGKPE